MSRKGQKSSKAPKHSKHRHQQPLPTADSATLLARGYTARWIKGKQLAALTVEEVDQDLRHMSAFWTAAQRYQQTSYAALNRILPKPGGSAGATSASATHLTDSNLHPAASGDATGGLMGQPPLPVRLDPDHDKRQQAQRQRLAQAEWMREALEQEYVAVRAHYVETCQELQALTKNKEQRSKWLLECVHNKAQQLALLRAQVQMARECKAALDYRQNRSGPQQGTDSNIDPSAPAPTPSSSTATATTVAATSSNSNALLQVWDMLEAASKQILKNSASQNQKPLAWVARQEPATVRGVPLLVSTVSQVPEKSLAWACDDRAPDDENEAENVEEQATDAKQKKADASNATDKDKKKKEAGKTKENKTKTTPRVTWAEPPALTPEGQAQNLNECPLVWMHSQLPQTIGDLASHEEGDEEADGMDVDRTGTEKDREIEAWLLNNTSDGATVRSLRREVQKLQDQLVSEGRRNSTCLAETAQYRGRLDEWTTMISMVRQETEAILYRHNVLQQSPEVLPKAEEAWEKLQAAGGNTGATTADTDNEDTGATGSADEDQSTTAGLDTADEDEEEEATPPPGNTSAAWNLAGKSKREEGDSPAARKRRKL